MGFGSGMAPLRRRMLPQKRGRIAEILDGNCSQLCFELPLSVIGRGVGYGHRRGPRNIWNRLRGRLAC